MWHTSDQVSPATVNRPYYEDLAQPNQATSCSFNNDSCPSDILLRKTVDSHVQVPIELREDQYMRNLWKKFSGLSFHSYF